MKVKVTVRQKPNPEILRKAVAASLQRIRERLENDGYTDEERKELFSDAKSFRNSNDL